MEKREPIEAADTAQRGAEASRNTTLLWLLLLASLFFAAFTGYQVWSLRQEYAEGHRRYESLANSIRKIEKAIGAPLKQGTPQVEIPLLAIDLEALDAERVDAVAWLYCPGTAIDCPVIKAENCGQQPRCLPDETCNMSGPLLLDHNCVPDFSSRLNILRSHRLRSEKLFSSLMGYQKQAYFAQYPYLYLYAKQGNYRIDLLYGCTLEADEWRDQALMSETDLDSLLGYAASNTTFTSDVAYTENDRFLALVACGDGSDDARYLVMGVLKPEYQEVGE